MMQMTELERRIGNVLDNMDMYELVELHNSVARDKEEYDCVINFMTSFIDVMAANEIDEWEVSAMVQESGRDYNYRHDFFILKAAQKNDADVKYVLQSSDNPLSFIDRKRLAHYLALTPGCHYGCLDLVNFYHECDAELLERRAE